MTLRSAEPTTLWRSSDQYIPPLAARVSGVRGSSLLATRVVVRVASRTVEVEENRTHSRVGSCIHRQHMTELRKYLLQQQGLAGLAGWLARSVSSYARYCRVGSGLEESRYDLGMASMGGMEQWRLAFDIDAIQQRSVLEEMLGGLVVALHDVANQMSTGTDVPRS